MSQMTRAFPDAAVTGHDSLIEAMTNDTADRHVLAAAITVGADVIVTCVQRTYGTGDPQVVRTWKSGGPSCVVWK